MTSRRSVWARTVHGFAEAIAAVESDQLGGGDGPLERMDPRAKIVSFLILATATASMTRFWPLAGLLLLALTLTAAARIPLPFLIGRALFPAMALAILLALPIALFPAAPAAPDTFAVRFAPTGESLLRAGTLMMRVIAATTFCCVLLVTTRWSFLLKAIRSLGAPSVLVSVLALSFRYSVYFFRTAQEMFEAAESRRVGRLSGSGFRQRLAAQIGVLTGKTATMSEAVHLAMISRGYRSEARIFHEFAMRPGDWLAIGFALSLAVALVVFAR